jgi:hypothetical protein
MNNTVTPQLNGTTVSELLEHNPIQGRTFSQEK